MNADRYPQISVHSRAEWRAWLATNHSRTESIWLVTYKKGAGVHHVTYDEIVEEALCFGWVDSLPRKLDDQRKMILVSPRRKGSAWSKVNKARVDHLIRAGLMMPPGLEKIERAKADGSWSILDHAENEVMPPDVKKALRATPGSTKAFAALPRSLRKGLLGQIALAKRPETRAQRIQRLVTISLQRLADRNSAAS
jgi:uncharacterized protein YdeI (YjbR/CyaY-like superfamily)